MATYLLQGYNGSKLEGYTITPKPQASADVTNSNAPSASHKRSFSKPAILASILTLSIIRVAMQKSVARGGPSGRMEGWQHAMSASPLPVLETENPHSLQQTATFPPAQNKNSLILERTSPDQAYTRRTNVPSPDLHQESQTTLVQLHQARGCADSNVRSRSPAWLPVCPHGLPLSSQHQQQWWCPRFNRFPLVCQKKTLSILGGPASCDQQNFPFGVTPASPSGNNQGFAANSPSVLYTEISVSGLPEAS
ncbi:hypothetical protein HPG69_005977 [Diceros bicornis minor]|uniref:Uncharacterized protein n=1 Tax=Diceros bicornis minor TaxID=77932 RepID=A0A7J7ETZ3_DICBM|nr:hypothetical protein HPG69_005977 [Diceros bicornis minor]